MEQAPYDDRFMADLHDVMFAEVEAQWWEGLKHEIKSPLISYSLVIAVF